MYCICTECQTKIEIHSTDPEKFIECPACAMTLAVTAVEGDEAKVEIVEMGK